MLLRIANNGFQTKDHVCQAAANTQGQNPCGKSTYLRSFTMLK